MSLTILHRKAPLYPLWDKEIKRWLGAICSHVSEDWWDQAAAHAVALGFFPSRQVEIRSWSATHSMLVLQESDLAAQT